MLETLTLKTCRRTEHYHDGGTINISEARHLFRVAAGLESPLLGETAILGQVRRAYDEARSRGKLTPNINKLFQTAIMWDTACAPRPPYHEAQYHTRR